MNNKHLSCKPFLSICITSYNRVDELYRCLKSIDSVYKDNIEIIVSEDCSPKKVEIAQIVNRFMLESDYNLLYNTNIYNLGYDRNLGKLIELANGKYILFMSDDDTFNANVFDDYFDSIMTQQPPMAFSSFICNENLYRKYNKSFHIYPNTKESQNHTYDSILFSGLTFKKELVQSINSERFLNSYYFQVYLFNTIINKYGANYINIPLVICHGDGVNGFGVSESSLKNENLANRKSVFSILEFNKALVKVLDICDNENGTNIKFFFSREYSIRTYPGLSRAKKMGKEIYKQYISMLYTLDIKFSNIVFCYRVMLFLFGANISDRLMHFPRIIKLKINSLS